MIIKKLRRLVEEYRRNHKNEISLLKELNWANIYHDSIRGKKWLQDLPLNIGRWAGDYVFFYVLNRILIDCKPKNILEFGLGESSKFVSVFLDNYLNESNHLIIEQNISWYERFVSNFKLSHKTQVNICKVVTKQVNGQETSVYESINELVNAKYDLYIIDGPIGSKQYSRYNIVELAKVLTSQDDFIIIIDDYNRKGEQQTVLELIRVLKDKNIKVQSTVYEGSKSLVVIATEKYNFLSSL